MHSMSQRQLSGAPVILMYHRIAEERSDPWGLCVSREHFAEHLEVLRRHASVLPLDRLWRGIVDGTAARGSVAVTFDDGYVDNLVDARPLLERSAVPATVFVASGYTGSERAFWWDELERILLEPGDLPASFTTTIGGVERRLDLGRSAHYPATAAASHASWRAYASDSPTERHAVFLSTWEQLVALRDAEQREALDSLRAATKVPAVAASGRRALTPTELVRLTDGGLVDIGAHTVTHPALPLFPSTEQWVEIRDSRMTLESMLGRRIAGFSYPHGRFDASTVRLVRDTRYEYACAAVPHPTSPAGLARQFTLGRLMVPDCDGDAFLRLLTEGADAH